ncbi:two component system transcriptional regulatory protein [Azoarcus olearius]|uniref:response regulator n=1 Tax=Azoarcus sp. (strain BH72) TaxID=418699 RepID=UPI000806339D|nr:response regulator [Azoarcus olearius]ANQ85963.1 two component system transcriptional regulatory protein [Azoarcus olearius]
MDITVLVVEDEPQIRRLVRNALEGENYRVFTVDSGKRSLIEAGTRKADLIVLDLGLPDLDGMEVLRGIRAWSHVPVLILSARGEEDDKIRALDEGADDYLAKPFGVGELLARVRALVRRHVKHEDSSGRLNFGEVEADFVRRTVVRNGEAVHLTKIEYRLLTVLAANAGKVLTHNHLMREVWGPAYVDSNHYLRIYVGRLRQKLEADPAQPVHFLTETGVGYRFEP